MFSASGALDCARYLERGGRKEHNSLYGRSLALHAAARKGDRCGAFLAKWKNLSLHQSHFVFRLSVSHVGNTACIPSDSRSTRRDQNHCQCSVLNCRRISGLSCDRAPTYSPETPVLTDAA